MIGKPEWFKYRVVAWGFRPKTWQGWAYIMGVIALFPIIEVFSIDETKKVWLFGTLLTAVIIDLLHIITQLSKSHDQKEILEELIIERNVSFVAGISIVAIIIYQTYQHGALISKIPFDISLGIVIGAMLVTKIISRAHVSEDM